MAKKVLLVDDDFSYLQRAKKMLEKENIEVHVATNGALAWDLFKLEKFDLVLLDIKMSTLSGYDLARLLKERANGVFRLVFVSIVPKKEVNLSKVDGFIQKPFDEGEYVKAVKKFLG